MKTTGPENAKSASTCDTLIIGGGRMATQSKIYLKKLGIPYSSWLRSEGSFTLGSRAREAKRVLLLIPDKSISKFVDEYDVFLKNKTLVHFSATLRDSRVLGFHPLGSFTVDQEIDFAQVQYHGVHPESLFREALPFLKNSYKQLSEAQMQTYHALCVLGGNFTAILWNSFFKEMQKLGIEESSAKAYFEMINNNITSNHCTAVTGPLVRNDQITLDKNLKALGDKKELKEIYEAFVKTFHGSEYLK